MGDWSGRGSSSISRKNQKIMTTKVCFITCASPGIGAEIAKATRVDGNQVAAVDRKPEIVTKAPGSADYLMPATLDGTHADQIEVAPLLPIISVAFTVGGPLVYQLRSDQFA